MKTPLTLWGQGFNLQTLRYNLRSFLACRQAGIPQVVCSLKEVIKMSDTNLTFKVARLHRLENSNSVKAFVDLVVNDSLLIRGLRIISGEKGFFVAMPKEQGKDNRWYDLVRPIDKETRADIASVVLEAYNQK